MIFLQSIYSVFKRKKVFIIYFIKFGDETDQKLQFIKESWKNHDVLQNIKQLLK